MMYNGKVEAHKMIHSHFNVRIVPTLPWFLLVRSLFVKAAIRQSQHWQHEATAQTVASDMRGTLSGDSSVVYHNNRYSATSSNDFSKLTATDSDRILSSLKTTGRFRTNIPKGATTLHATDDDDINVEISNASFQEKASHEEAVGENESVIERVNSSKAQKESPITSSFSRYPAFQYSSDKRSGGSVTTSSSVMETEISPFEKFLNLTTDILAPCFGNGDPCQFRGMSGRITFSGAANASLGRQRRQFELLLPAGMVYVMGVSLIADLCGVLRLSISQPDGSSEDFPCKVSDEFFRSSNNSVAMELIYVPPMRADMFIEFKSIPQPRVELTFTSPTTGYVQSPAWDGVSTYPILLDLRRRLPIPADHSVMVSFLHLDIESTRHCDYDYLALIVRGEADSDDGAESSREIVLCNSVPFPEPQVFRTNLLSFRFVTDGVTQRTGFKLLFSFHHESAVPEKASSALWNCSVDFWPQFRHHLGLCNAVEACYGGEDEANCSHLTQGCGPGSFFIGGRCYVLVVEDSEVTWNEAASECFRRSAYLASLNSPEEWDGVMGFIKNISGRTFYFGLQASGPRFPELYRKMFQWSDESAAFYFNVFVPESSEQVCSLLTHDVKENLLFNVEIKNYLKIVDCDRKLTDTFLCEKDSTGSPRVSHEPLRQIRIHGDVSLRSDSHVPCPAGHAVFNFLACDVKSECWADQMNSPRSSCGAPVTPLPPSFECSNGFERVPYMLVCDHFTDCGDNSDENFCVFPSCRRSGKFLCGNLQCVPLNKRCDGRVQCLDGSDERQCVLKKFMKDNVTPKPPAVIDFDGGGFFKVKPLDVNHILDVTPATSPCPETHFLCPGDTIYCMPVFVRCNGVPDCPGREDEADCDNYVCPGFYRCRASPICFHPQHECDGVYQCPQGDDELLCGFACPGNCTCHGLAFTCCGAFPAEEFGELRFLDGRRSRIIPEDVRNVTMLVFLNVAECDLTHLNYVELPNLRILDLRKNQIQSIEAEELRGVSNLQTLSLAGNPLTSLFLDARNTDLHFSYLQILDVSEVLLSALDMTTFSIFPNLLHLNLSGTGAERLVGEGFHSLKRLKYLDLRKCPMDEFPADVFGALPALTEVWADNYKLCCPAVLPPDFLSTKCHSPSDEISSCDALLHVDFYRVVLSIFSTLALLGNLGSFLYRVFVKRTGSNLGFGAFVTHLCVSDFLMGVYLAAIGVADRIYLGSYLWKDTVWKKSAACKMAGFLSLLSCEVSAFIICLITLDRFLVLRFPFSRLHFKHKSAHVACGIAWSIGIVLAAVPLLPLASHWDFYSQNGICIPLPITRNNFPGHDYSFSVTIIVNFVLFLFIMTGQVFVYWSIQSNSVTAADTTKKSKDLTIARRLVTVVLSDFLCWFPIGLLGLLAFNGVPVPGEVNVAVAVIILPVNSAINPFLYTLNLFLATRKQDREKQLQKMITSTKTTRLADKAVGTLVPCAIYTEREALGSVKIWISEGILSLANMEEIISNERL